MDNNINIFILVGGFGTRLQSVVSNVPKPMAPIGTRPFLDYQIDEIRKYYPENKIYLLTYYKSEYIEEYYKDNKLIEIIKEPEPLGTGGSIKNALEVLSLKKEDQLLVFNGDTYIKPNLIEMVKHAKNKITILGSFQYNCDRYGTLELQENNIVDFHEKKLDVKESYINAGCYLFLEIDFFISIKDRKFSIENEFKKYLLNQSIGMYGYREIFIDIGIPEDYEKMQTYIESN